MNQLNIKILVTGTIIALIVAIMIIRNMGRRRTVRIQRREEQNKRDAGGYIEYTREKQDYKRMNTTDKVAFGVYMLKYNTKKAKNAMDGVEELKSIKGLNDIIKVGSPGEMMVRIKFILTFLVSTLFLVLIALFVFFTLLKIMKSKRAFAAPRSKMAWQAMLFTGSAIVLFYFMSKLSDITVEKMNKIRTSAFVSTMPT